MLDFFKNLFKKKKTDEEIEEELTEQIIEENHEEFVENASNGIIASVVAYQMADDGQQALPVILVENFTGGILPEPDSVIWISIDNMLRPFVTVRYDFIQNENEIDSIRVYIVVRAAKLSELIP